MWKAAFVGALALIAVGIAPAGAQQSGISEGHIAQAKAVLRLRPEQEKYWPRVAAALRAAGRAGRVQVAEAGMMQGARERVSGAASQAAAARRVLAAAMPLIKTLDPEQKQAARSLVSAMGYSHLAAGI